MKKSLILYYDLDSVFRMMTKEEVGQIICAAFDYELRGERTEFEDRMLQPRVTSIIRTRFLQGGFPPPHR